MRVLLVNPPSPAGTTINREGAAGLGNRYDVAGAFLYPPQTLATTAAVLHDAGHATAVLDATAEQLSLDTALEKCRSASPQTIGVLLSWSGWESDLAFCRALRGVMAGVPIVTMGTILRQPEWAKEAASVSNVVLVGEPERALPVAVRAAVAGEAPMGQIAPAHELVPASYDVNGFMTDIESLPLPAWELTPVGRYRMLTLLSSRGCDKECLYCPYVFGWGGEFRACSPRRVADELGWLMERFRPERIMFRDPVFAHDRGRVAGICEEIQARRLGVSWECESRPEHFDRELLELMYEAGCTTVKIGLESADPRRLAAMGRIARPEDAETYLGMVREATEACRQIGLRCHLFTMVGWPDADDVEIKTTARFLETLPPAYVSVKTLELYPGTRWVEAGGGVDTKRAERHKGQLLAAAHPDSPAQRSLWRKGLAWVWRKLA